MVHREIFLSYLISFIVNFTIFAFSFSFFSFGELKKPALQSFLVTLDLNKDFVKPVSEPVNENIALNNKEQNITEETKTNDVSIKKGIEKKNHTIKETNRSEYKKIDKRIERQTETRDIAISEAKINSINETHQVTELIQEHSFTNNMGTNEQSIIEGQNKNEELSLLAGISKQIPPKELTFGSVNGPNFKEKVEPVYPIKARRLGKEGIVKVKLKIDEEGRLIDITFIEDPGYGFKESVLQALKKSTFTPATENGKPIPSIALLTISFKLED